MSRRSGCATPVHKRGTAACCTRQRAGWAGKNRGRVQSRRKRWWGEQAPADHAAGQRRERGWTAT